MDGRVGSGLAVRLRRTYRLGLGQLDLRDLLFAHDVVATGLPEIRLSAMPGWPLVEWQCFDGGDEDRLASDVERLKPALCRRHEGHWVGWSLWCVPASAASGFLDSGV